MINGDFFEESHSKEKKMNWQKKKKLIRTICDEKGVEKFLDFRESSLRIKGFRQALPHLSVLGVWTVSIGLYLWDICSLRDLANTFSEN
ncbi:hypothetical protein TNIN_248601 [Trichonephila inaurata madagascariensis]|uniref:Uncharacterized protein n=1 Tax=Trichonephila inaurata madagascariensis TaxID=2747483 RepID=A0A8X7BU55_9ARAC|nr:hypothetical protein TNIN_248601 [Trichonephila inaurata madagascariensis]